MSEDNKLSSIVKKEHIELESEGMITITVDDLHFGYKSSEVLKGVNFKLDEPQLVSIIGPNGVGKSTFVQCLNKILKVKQGTVYYNEHSLEDLTIKNLSKVVGYVPCATGSSFPITVIDAVMLGRHPHATLGSQKRDLEISYRTLDQLGISEFAMRHLNELSAGQLQKVMLAKGLAQEPRILILDEPTANLDIRHQMNVTRMLFKLAHESGIIIIMICHDLNIASKYSDQIFMMYKGLIYAAGPPEEVITEENIREVYGVKSKVIMDEGRPHVLIRGDVDDDESETEAPATEADITDVPPEPEAVEE